MIRNPAVSGIFYPSDRGRLESMIDSFLSRVKKGNNRGVISPHAGYPYSGLTQSFALRSLKPSERFVIIGNSHRSTGETFAISRDDWKTPLGLCSNDQEMSYSIMECDLVKEDDLPHTGEHSVEVQLPFLQRIFGEVKIAAISIANASYSDGFLENCIKLGKHIAPILGEARLIASSDFSHYLPARIAEEKDRKAMERIMDLDTKGFFSVLEETDASVCGFGPIAVMMSAAEECGWEPGVLHHSTSGDVTGDKGSVVSYYAVGFS